MLFLHSLVLIEHYYYQLGPDYQVYYYCWKDHDNQAIATVCSSNRESLCSLCYIDVEYAHVYKTLSDPSL